MQLTPYKETSKGDKKSGLDIEIYYNGEKIGIDNLIIKNSCSRKNV